MMSLSKFRWFTSGNCGTDDLLGSKALHKRGFTASFVERGFIWTFISGTFPIDGSNIWNIICRFRERESRALTLFFLIGESIFRYLNTYFGLLAGIKGELFENVELSVRFSSDGEDAVLGGDNTALGICKEIFLCDYFCHPL